MLTSRSGNGTSETGIGLEIHVLNDRPVWIAFLFPPAASVIPCITLRSVVRALRQGGLAGHVLPIETLSGGQRMRHATDRARNVDCRKNGMPTHAV